MSNISEWLKYFEDLGVDRDEAAVAYMIAFNDGRAAGVFRRDEIDQAALRRRVVGLGCDAVPCAAPIDLTDKAFRLPENKVVLA